MNTGWMPFPTDEIYLLFDTFPEFIAHYAAFLGTEDDAVYDTWSSTEFRDLGASPDL